jgi:beta-glucosidase/6-phospho-beta-glucosidase/beta-galactosidase
VNHYTTELVYPTSEEDINLSEVSWFADADVSGYQDPKWYSSASSWLKVCPFGIRNLMNWLTDTYGSQWDIYITENGFSDYLGNIDDLQRVYYFKHYINQLLKAVKVDGCNVKGYFAWSLLDNFEWAKGYSEKFGLHNVDFDDPARPRTPKASSRFIKELATNNGFVEA